MRRFDHTRIFRYRDKRAAHATDRSAGHRAAFFHRISQQRERRGRAVRARALEAYLSSQGGFGYSLAPVPRDRVLDPIEDFVTLHRVGHCEYFASALTLMLRSVGIPSRMVMGFKGGDWNDLGRFYQVRQLHTHAWVEAYLTREQVEVYLAREQVEAYLARGMHIDDFAPNLSFFFSNGMDPEYTVLGRVAYALPVHTAFTRFAPPATARARASDVGRAQTRDTGRAQARELGPKATRSHAPDAENRS